uniref:Deoxynucleoside kinase domain-containing protein n=1 Tax=viral metagenome TaxID=1070528 RepID=A0A6C0B1W8_9ZZZZ
MTRLRIYSIEGNIGSGKTTIIENLQKTFENNPNVVFIREPVDIWQTIQDANGETILAKFYKDPAKYAFTFQVMAYSTRLSMLRAAILQNPRCDVIICERSLDADKHIFEKMLYNDGLIDEVSHQIYQRFYGEFQDEFQLAGIIYIDADAQVCKERIEKRARVGEETVALDYLEKCQSYHEAWLSDKELNAPVLKIKTNEEVTYDLTCPNDKGLVWMMQIVEFISLTNVQKISPVESLDDVCGRPLERFEEFYNPNI